MKVDQPDFVQLGFARMERDLNYLMDCFAEVLEEMGLGELAGHLPWRGAVKSQTQTPPRLELALSVAFQLLNMVEENASGQTRILREYGHGAEPGTWGDQIGKLVEQGFSAQEIVSAMKRIRVEPVLTAHPTEAKRLSVLDQHRVLFGLLERASRQELSNSQSRVLRKEVKAVLERLWRTGEIILEKPTLTDERRNVLHYLREVFPSVLPALDERLRQAWIEAGFDVELLREPGVLPRIRFGTWVGGDRDGHPGVTAEVTAETLERLRVNALLVAYNLLTNLSTSLSLTSWMQAPPQVLLDAIEAHETALGADVPPVSHKDEPWRRCVELMAARLPLEQTSGRLAQLSEGAGKYAHPHELLADLDVLSNSLEQVGGKRLVDSDVSATRRGIEVFGFHLAQLDVRQNSVFHAKALTQLLGASSLSADDWEDWSEMERLRFLEKELRSPRPFLHAARLELAHPVTREPLAFDSVLPDDLVAVESHLED